MLRSYRARSRVLALIVGIYGVVFVAFLGAGIYLAFDLKNGRTRIIAERTAMAVQTSRFMSQWFGTTIMATDYVLRDITTKVTPAELDSAGSDPKVMRRLSEFVRQKLATLPGVFGLGFYDHRCVFVAAADERLVGIRSNQKSCIDPNSVLEDRTYIQYVSPGKSANKQPAVLVSRHLLSSDGRLLGGALAAIMIGSAQEWIETFNVSVNDVIAMVDEDGILLAHNPPLPEAIGKLMPPPPGQPRFDDQRASASFIGVSPLDGRERIYGLSKVENVPLTISVGYDMAENLREWRRRVWQLSAGFLALLFLLGMVLRGHLVALVQREEMRKLAITDPLTGVANRRQLTSTGEREVARAVRYQLRMSVLMVDIDHFKSINDTWGHPTGDRAIQALANAMTANVRAQDAVGRLGGEEFAVVMPETDKEGALVLAERLRENIERSVAILSDDGTEVRFTISIGVAGLDADTSSFEDILGRADQALYAAKCGGRNQVVAA